MWAARLLWLVLALAGGGAFGGALASHSRGVQVVGTAALWVGWGAAALALAIPSTVSLTVARTVAPMALAGAVCAAVAGGATATQSTLAIGLAAVATVAIATGEFGQRFAQGSAYGDEQRFVLRPPVVALIAVAVTWPMLCAGALASPLLLGAANWVLGVPVLLLTTGAGWVLGQRYHRLSRRWLVIVPAGVVVHDHVVLAETVMLAAANVTSLHLALAGTDAADLTGPASGNAVEVTVRDLVTVVFAGTRGTPQGTAIHAGGMLVAPSRPGAMLQAAADRRLPVG